MVSEKMVKLGTNRSVIRDLFEYGNQRKAEIGADKVFDFSLGNPSVPAPPAVREAALDLLQNEDELLLHGYTSAQGDAGLREKIAAYINGQHGVHLTADNLYITVGAAASLTISLKALTEEGDEFITFAPFFPEYRVFVENAGASLVVADSDPEDFQIDCGAFEKAVTAHTKGVILNSPNNPSGVVITEDRIRELKVPYLMNYYDNTIVCYSYSKSLSLPGERIGYIRLGEGGGVEKDLCGGLRRGPFPGLCLCAEPVSAGGGPLYRADVGRVDI